MVKPAAAWPVVDRIGSKGAARMRATRVASLGASARGQFVALLGLLLGLGFLIGRTRPAGPLGIALLTLAKLIPIAVTGMQQPPAARWRWALLGLGLAAVALATIWRALPTRAIPGPAWVATALLALGYGFLFGGLIRLDRTRPSPARLPSLLDALVLLIAATMVTWAVVLAPILATPARSPANQAQLLVAAIGGLSLLGVL